MERLPASKRRNAILVTKTMLPMGDDNPLVQPQPSYVELLLKSNIKLVKFFESISNSKGLLDPHKLGELVKHEFKEFSDRIFDILKKVFANFKVPVDFALYSDTI